METSIDILILETDRSDSLAIVQEMQRHALGIRTLTTRHPTEALPSITSRPPDVVLAAVAQPEAWLFELLENLKESRPSLPVIVITSRCEPGNLVELLECGAAAHVRRQNLNELSPIIRFALENPLPEASASELEVIRESWSSPSQSQRGNRARTSCTSIIVQRICEHCSRIADMGGQWERINVVLRRNHKATITLGLCPDCARTHSEERALPQPLPF